MGRAFGLLFVAVGCGGGQLLAGDQDGDDGTAEDGSVDVESRDDGTDAAPDAGAEDGAVAEDGDVDDVPVSRCPEVLAGEGPVRFTVRWRHREPWAWASPGSAGVGVVAGVVFAAQPSSPWVAGSEPFDVRLDAETGEPLASDRRRAVTGARVVVVRSMVDQFEIAAFPPGIGDRPGDPYGVFVQPDGRTGGGWGYAAEPYGYEIVLPSAARIVAGPEGGANGTIEGQAIGGAWGVDGGDLWLGDGLFPLYRGPALAGDAFAAYSLTSAGRRYLWTVDDQLVLTSGGYSEIRRVPLDWGAAYVPASPSRPGATDSDFLIAGRCLALVLGVGMRTEKRRVTDLAMVTAHHLDAYDFLVDWPEPRDLVGDAGLFALAWVAQRLPEDPSKYSCLYATPLDEDGAPTGPAVRVDDAPTPSDEAPVEHVRVVLGDGSFFVLWRREPDMWLARVDHAEP
jgi:hypothetical protein